MTLSNAPAVAGTPLLADVAASTSHETSSAAEWTSDLGRWFEAEFTLLDVAQEGAVAAVDGDWRPLSTEAIAAVRRAHAKRKPEVVRADLASSLLIVPLVDLGCGRVAAVAELPTIDDRRLLRTAEMYLAKARAERRAAELERESGQLSQHIASTYEEITLIHRLTQNLSISQKPTLLGLQAMEWMTDVVPATGLAIYFNTAFDEDLFSRDALNGPAFLMHGRVPIGADRFLDLLEHLHIAKSTRPFVLNGGVSDDPTGIFAEVREMIVVGLVEGDRQFGWLVAFNHTDGREFGTVEANLLASVGTILSIHSGNIDLYKQQADLFAGVVRAMSSAIDAKDPYTRGHSDRVARVAVRLAEKLGCDNQTLRTIYLGGLLHDVGKIGIDDGVLRKPGKLTDAEYEHIKTHVEIGYRILRGLRKMGHLLPIVLHHHESWDGKGYPFGLAGTGIPFLARIVAVADAYDAMSSDRPYRKGMEDAKLDAIFQAGAGKQWDPDVIAAFFAVRDDIRDISHREPDPIDAVTIDWAH
jgi:putative nucleotidyltransferase with HDIG domain